MKKKIKKLWEVPIGQMDKYIPRVGDLIYMEDKGNPFVISGVYMIVSLKYYHMYGDITIDRSYDTVGEVPNIWTECNLFRECCYLVSRGQKRNEKV